jgi:hypothetical protein
MMRMNTIVSVLAACGLLSGGLALAGASPAAAVAKKAPPVVIGVVKYKGKPVSGAEVLLFAEPQPSKLKKDSHKHLAKIPLKVIGSGKSDKKGRYAISVSGKGLRLADAYSFTIHTRGKATERVVNLQVEAYWSAKQYGDAFWFVRLVLSKSVSGAMLGATAQDSTAPAGSLAAEAAPQVANLTVAPMYVPKSLEASVHQAMRAAGAVGGPDLPIPLAACEVEDSMGDITNRGTNPNGTPNNTIVSDEPAVLTDVGETYSNMSDVTMGFQYYAGQNSSLGVGITIQPPQGFKYPQWGLDFASAGWQDSVQVGANVPYNGAKGYANIDYTTKFVYQLNFEPCVGFSTAPIGWGGTNAQKSAYPPQSETNQYCAWFQPDKAAYGFSKSTAVEFTTGVNISFWAGIDLSSQTGYDGEATATYLLPKGGWICGTNFYAGNDNEGLIYAGKYVHSPKAKKAGRRARR